MSDTTISDTTINDKWTYYHSLGVLFTIVAVSVVGLLLPATQILWIWFVVAAAMTLFTMLASHGVTGRFWTGWLINEQYRMSLSRLQMFLWTVVILSAFFAAVLLNIKAGHQVNALNIGLPEELWLALGISTTALVGSPLILGQKKEKPTNQDEARRTTMRSLGVGPSSGTRSINPAVEQKVEEQVQENFTGQLQRNSKPKDAKLSDLVRGEETSNWNVLDLSRLQNLFFTLILVGGYAATLGAHLVATAGTIEAAPMTAFPELTTGFVALLGISHAGYLAAKAVDKQPTGDNES